MSKKTKALLLQMKLNPNYEMRILAEETIVNEFVDLEKRNAELREQVERMKNCFNCKRDVEDHCFDNLDSVACDRWGMKQCWWEE